ncbi:MAG: hypothetical protein HKN22_02805 [Bacteroidia bacterium]|nr:hypothetical protein [Bacteroidia bacterium]
MKSQDAVYDLVKSLSKQEKRYFKLYASRHLVKGSNKHLIMFDVFSTAKDFDEQKLKEKISDKALRKRFSVAKYQMGQHVLRSLAAFHSFNSVDARIHEKIQQIQILYQKALLEQCNKLIRSTKEFCYKYEKYNFLIQLIDIERENYIISKFHKTAASEIAVLKTEKKIVLEKMRSIKACMDLADEFYLLRNTIGRVRNSEQRTKLNQLVSVPVFAEESLAFTPLAKVWWHRAQVGYGFLVGNTKHWLEHAYKMVTVFDENADLISDNVRFYLSSLFILAYAQFDSKLTDDFKLTLNRMKQVEFDHPRSMDMIVRGYMFETIYTLELRYYIKSGKFKEAKKCVKEINDLLPQFEQKIAVSDELVLWYCMACVQFGLKDYRKCINWLNKVIETAHTETREDIQSAVRILNLICHYELEHSEYLPYVYRSTVRFLSQRKRLFPMEKLFLSYLRKVNDVINRAELKRIFEELGEKLESEKNRQAQIVADTEFDLNAWLVSKISKKDFAEVVKDKWQTT